MAIHMGYMGECRIDGELIKISGSTLNPVQTIEAPDLVQGHWMRHAWNYGKVEVGGNITGPVSENHTSIFDMAFDRAASGDKMANENITIEIAYYQGAGRKFNGCAINSYEISVTAGEVAQFSIDFFGTSPDATTSVEAYTGSNDPVCEKLITWDRCAASGTFQGNDQVQAWTFRIDNNMQRIYKIDPAAAEDLYPVDLLAGFRDISGTVSVYNDVNVHTGYPIGTFGADNFTDYNASPQESISFIVGNPAVITLQANVEFDRVQANAATGPMVVNLTFKGICLQDGD